MIVLRTNQGGLALVGCVREETQLHIRNLLISCYHCFQAASTDGGCQTKTGFKNPAYGRPLKLSRCAYSSTDAKKCLTCKKNNFNKHLFFLVSFLFFSFLLDVVILIVVVVVVVVIVVVVVLYFKNT